jgi:hypothetical protein
MDESVPDGAKALDIKCTEVAAILLLSLSPDR